jgi:hypothetical protein
MKILLQHTRTLLYLRSTEGWTRNDAEARTFQHSQKAIEFAHEHHLTDLYIAVKFPDEHDAIVAPVPAFRQSMAIEVAA